MSANLQPATVHEFGQRAGLHLEIAKLRAENTSLKSEVSALLATVSELQEAFKAVSRPVERVQ